jgi:hypothetical protein
MSEDQLRYDRFVERALRHVVRETLEQVARHGLPGEHHLYITFKSEHPDVVMPDSLRAVYPEEMTVVLQYQFWDLLIEEDQFLVTLSFNDARERITVPFAAISAFADPSVNFALQFQTGDEAAESVDFTGTSKPDTDAPGSDGNVVTLDQFRKK